MVLTCDFIGYSNWYLMTYYTFRQKALVESYYSEHFKQEIAIDV